MTDCADVSIAELAGFVAQAERLLIITGAGLSAPSGIETYRDDAGRWRRAPPIQHQDFLRSPATRARYWARSMHGWPAISEARPNAAHEALVALEALGKVESVVTQNVDGLHQRAGQQRVIELHGSLARVVCLEWGSRRDRTAVQTWLTDRNPRWLTAPAEPRPDGDAEIVGQLDDFAVPECACGGVLKPDVVFYGDSVPRDRVERVREHLAAADALLVVGSSLMVYSSFRFVKEGHVRGLPMAAINRGATRADGWFHVKWLADSAVALPQLVRTL
ncbi:MAG: NAD-dependent protein deacetylase [Gammaproteobacteria bacterium]